MPPSWKNTYAQKHGHPHHTQPQPEQEPAPVPAIERARALNQSLEYSMILELQDQAILSRRLSYLYHQGEIPVPVLYDLRVSRLDVARGVMGR